MSETLHRVLDLVERRQIRVSAHGFDEMAEDGIMVKDVLAHVLQAVAVEDYPDFHKGPGVLVLQQDLNSQSTCYGAYLRVPTIPSC